MVFLLKNLCAVLSICHEWLALPSCCRALVLLLSLSGLARIQGQSPLGDTDHDRFPDVYETLMGGNATNPAITPSTTQANYITVDPTVPTSATGRTYTTVQAAISAIPVNAYGIVVVNPGTYSENINISNRHVLLLAQSTIVPVVLASLSSSNTLSISGGANDTVLDGFVISRTKSSLDSRGANISMTTAAHEVAFKNCVFRANKYSTGAGVYVSQGVVWITHCTFAQNEATTAKAIYVGSTGKLKMQNSILWDIASGSATEVYRQPSSVPANEQIIVTASIIRGGELGALAADPLLGVRGEISSPVSAAINIGAPLANAGGSSLLGAPGKDVHGESRDYLLPDVGADEFGDNDADGMPDWWELKYFINLTALPAGNPDDDGLINQQEYMRDTSPRLADTDGDKAIDGLEVSSGTNPLLYDTDEDGMSDGYELSYLLNPLSSLDALEDPDGDRVPNLFEFRLQATNPNLSSSKPATLITVNPAVATETATVKKTIAAAVSAYSASASPFGIIEVKKGEYVGGALSLNKSGLLLLGEPHLQPATITCTATTYAVSIGASNIVLDGLRITHVQNGVVTGGACSVNLPVTTNPTAQAKLVNCQVVNNDCGTGSSAISVTRGLLTVAQCTIAGNISGNGCNGIKMDAYYADARLRLLNSILWNAPGAKYAGVSVVQVISASSQREGSFLNNVILGGELGALSGDPLLNKGHRVQVGSSAINPAGSLAGAGLAKVDIHGETRDAVPDYGADEYVDADGDGVADKWELTYYASLSASNGITNNDNDGATNAQESFYDSNPTVADTDADGATDGAEIVAGSNLLAKDSDLDGMNDGYELNYQLDPLNFYDALEDADGDRVPNLFEFSLGVTSPRIKTERPVATFTVDPSIATETATIKKTITSALAAASSAATAWKIIEVKKGIYREAPVISKSQILLLGEASLRPVTIAATVGGSALTISAPRVVLDGVRITHDGYTVYGRGLHINLPNNGYTPECRVVNCQILENDAWNTGGGFGGAIYLGNGTLSLINSTLVNNSSQDGSNGIYLNSEASSKLRLRNNIIWNPVAFGLQKSVIKQVSLSNPSQIIGGASSNMILGGEFGASAAAPWLDWDYRVRSGSPSINPAGGITGVSIPKEDMQGDTRDGQPDYGADEFLDADGDTLPDKWELAYFATVNTSAADSDPDGDVLRNKWEVLFDLNPILTDTNGNGQPDLQEALALAGQFYDDPVSHADADADGLFALQEMILGTSDTTADSNGDGVTDFLALRLGITASGDDTDQDGLTTAQELELGTSPLLSDTDGDGVLDGVDRFPFDPAHSALVAQPGDVTAPTIVLLRPGGTLIP